MLSSIAPSTCRSFPGAIRVASVAGKDDIQLPEYRALRSNIQADGAHQIERIAAGDDPGAHSVIENQTVILQPIFEVNIRRRGSEFVRYARECEVMRRDQSDGSAREQCM